MSRDEFIAALDQLEPEVSGKKALLLAKRKALAALPGQPDRENSKSNDKLLAASGFLTPKQRWSKRTSGKPARLHCLSCKKHRRPGGNCA